MPSEENALYVLGAESAGKTDLLMQIGQLCKGNIICAPHKVNPTTGQEIFSLKLPAQGHRVEVRELGGAMVNSWEAFIKARVNRDISAAATPSKYGLLFVIDASAPHQLSVALCMLRLLIDSTDGVCARWPVLVALQKCTAAHAMTRTEIEWLLLERPGGKADGEAVPIVEVDSWNGVGIADVLDWMESVL